MLTYERMHGCSYQCATFACMQAHVQNNSLSYKHHVWDYVQEDLDFQGMHSDTCWLLTNICIVSDVSVSSISTVFKPGFHTAAHYVTDFYLAPFFIPWRSRRTQSDNGASNTLGENINGPCSKTADYRMWPLIESNNLKSFLVSRHLNQTTELQPLSAVGLVLGVLTAAWETIDQPEISRLVLDWGRHLFTKWASNLVIN